MTYYFAIKARDEANRSLDKLSLPWLLKLDPRIVKPRGWAVAVLNHKAGLMTNKKLRQAFHRPPSSHRLRARLRDLARTVARRPDLIEARGGLSDEERRLLEELGQPEYPGMSPEDPSQESSAP